ncbi:MAG: Zn-dependent alcohol dehydrogenase [Gammaproteobacteria bacterium]|nr:Zn-dependent alcohol dehydrogenase [Gammaproteobacteria bacterium]
MKAAVCREHGKPLTIEELDLGPPGPGEVCVRIAACAICHSDILYAGGAWGGKLPAVYGHEAAGVVESVGEGVRHLAPGHHAVVTLVRSCGHCRCCEQGFYGSCETRFPLDENSPLRFAEDGSPVVQGLRTSAFAERVVVDASQAVAIPDAVPLDSASLLACGVITGFGAVTNTAKVPPGSATVVVGTGGVGLNSVQGAALSGARLIIAVDVADAKLEAALKFGATHAVNGASADPVEAVHELTAGRGADYVFVTVGAKSAIDDAYRMIAMGGAVVIVGMVAKGVLSEFDPLTLADSSQRILGSKMGSSNIFRDIPNLVSLYQQGRLKLDELITERYPLDGINEAMAASTRGNALRNVIVFD